MDKKKQIEEIKELIYAAEFLLKKTYPITKDEKIFLQIIRELYSSVSLMVQMITASDSKKLLEKVVETLDKTKFPTLIGLFDVLHKLQSKIDNDLISFKRYNNYVICTNNYKVQVISEDLLDKYIKQTKDSYFELYKELDA